MLALPVKVRLFLFSLIAVLGIAYVGGTYAGLDRLFGLRGYVVTAQFADSGGIFTNAEVTYRGVPVGRVGALRQAAGGVDVDLTISDDAPPIPADTQAVVANRSAVGEQFVDLVPARDGAPFLADGSVIARDRTEIPTGPDELLSTVDRLVSSVPVDSLRTVVDELDQAFRDTGPALRTLLDDTGALTAAATEHLPQTTALLSDGRVVLQTQAAQSDLIRSYSADLRTIAAQLKASDPDLRSLLKAGPAVSAQVYEVLRDSGPSLGVVLANLLTTAQITSTRVDGIEELLVAYPIMVAAAPSANPDGTGHLGLVLTFADPLSCTKGYETTKQRPANQVTDIPANTQAYCAEPPGSPVGVRGSQNAPYGGKPREVPAAPASAPGQPVPALPLPGTLGLPGSDRPPTLASLLGLMSG
ncbi:phospholipid/cholesterol/gamma-HCH transport system substrate-binding protein [Actinokineospora alba]|uniref:Phospholipid/cholesterol/gamma-HCH transport system substrate-binding protein n=1 Tax=Actinokineospora alba TaxID=504798 RepID=A0A1H0UJF2_9PSEU|nr:MCE family protein [Actinokineospora alba]TDP65051.1 phospholipid/cholesterol/gamma-HCH transport system substrate-binding protein [Actinokineospora alba]SDH52808.1 phospholipid/cholesterol/gamma-HCH transport system substrate-binding protein [Actinokineospora alba]SDP66098.1 phospholipid/cholesterol/gamma-HCH transport system substrate-binding protein [Actinokineospora alba]